MPLENERSFTADSAVGRYWLANCVGFRVEGARGGAGVVEEVALGADGVDMLAVRRRLLRSVVLVPAQRVAEIQPWEETIVLASQRRGGRGLHLARAQRLARGLRPPARAAAAATAQSLRHAAAAVRAGAAAIVGLLGAFATLLLGLAVVARERAPRARRSLSHLGSALGLLARAYVHEGRRALREERDALAVWREGMRRRPHAPDADAPLGRARADAPVRTRRRDYLRR